MKMLSKIMYTLGLLSSIILFIAGIQDKNLLLIICTTILFLTYLYEYIEKKKSIREEKIDV